MKDAEMDLSVGMSPCEGRGESNVDPGMQTGSGRTAPDMPLDRFVSRGTGWRFGTRSLVLEMRRREKKGGDSPP